MLGDEDHDIVDNEPINPDDLFDNDIVPPVSPSVIDPSAENSENPAQTDDTNDSAPAPRKFRQINRLGNLNDRWLTNPQKENIRKVNQYFEKIKFKSGKGREKINLKMILQRYEYFAQQCYPKLCFKDFVEKVEHVSGKRIIKHVLEDIRQGRNDIEDEENFDHEIDHISREENMDNENHIQPNSPSQPQSPSESNEPHLSQPPSASPSSSTTTYAAESSPKLTDEIRDIIRRKREEAIIKRKQKLEEPMNVSRLVSQDLERQTGDASSNTVISKIEHSNLVNNKS